jgi:ActR/RegA family two-component response regulator
MGIDGANGALRSHLGLFSPFAALSSSRSFLHRPRENPYLRVRKRRVAGASGYGASFHGMQVELFHGPVNRPVKSSPPQRRATILLVEGHPLVRQNLARFINLQSNLVVCGEASNSREGAAAAARLRPDLAIVGLALGKESGLWLVGLLRETMPELPVLVLSMHEEDLFALPALRAGARGFVMVQDAVKELPNAIRDVLAGGIYLSPPLRRRFWQEPRTKRGGPAL